MAREGAEVSRSAGPVNAVKDCRSDRQSLGAERTSIPPSSASAGEERLARARGGPATYSDRFLATSGGTDSYPAGSML